MADFAIATGIRWGNVAGLTWERIDLRRKITTIPAQQAKGRRSLSIPLSPWASWHIQAGTPVAVLRELGGWASVDQVQVYAHLARGTAAAYAGNAERGHTNGHMVGKVA